MSKAVFSLVVAQCETHARRMSWAKGALKTVLPLHARQRGFTMTELITVIVIVGILGAMVAPRFFDKGTFDSRGFYDQTIATLRYAQKAAIAQHRYACVLFPANNSITLTFGTTPGCVDGTLVNPSGTPYPITSSNAAYSVYPVGGFSFDALGKPSAAQDIEVKDYATHIIVEAETGYVH